MIILIPNGREESIINNNVTTFWVSECSNSKKTTTFASQKVL